jgi:hypothetical protein
MSFPPVTPMTLDRAPHEKCTDCTKKSKALPPPFPERAKQELVQGPRGPSESESQKTNVPAPTASVQDSRDLSARAVGDELRRIVALTIQPCRAAPTVRCLREGQDSSFVVTVHLSCRRSSDGVLRVYPGCSRGGRGADCGTQQSIYLSIYYRRFHTTVVRLLLLAYCSPLGSLVPYISAWTRSSSRRAQVRLPSSPKLRKRSTSGAVRRRAST